MASYWQGVLEWLAPSMNHTPSDFHIQTQSDCIELEDWVSLPSASPASSTSSLPIASTSDLSSSVRQRRKGSSRHSKSSSSPAAFHDPSPPLVSPPTSRSTSKPRVSSTSPRPSHSSFSPVLLIPGPGGLTTSLMFFPPDLSQKPRTAKQHHVQNE